MESGAILGALIGYFSTSIFPVWKEKARCTAVMAFGLIVFFFWCLCVLAQQDREPISFLFLVAISAIAGGALNMVALRIYTKR